MTRQFRKREDLHMVILPVVGRIRPNQVLKGDEFAKYVPHLLEEFYPAPSPVVEPPAAVLVLEPAVEVAPEPAVEVAVPVPVEEIPPPPPVEEVPAAPPVEVVEASAVETEEEEDDAESEPETVSELPAPGVPDAPPRRKRGRPRKGT